MKKRLKIAVFHLAFFYSGGGEKLVLEEMRELQKRGYDVVCFTPVLEKKLCYPDIIDNFPIKTLFPKLSSIFNNHESWGIIASCLLFPLIASRFKEFDVIFGANQPGPLLGWLVKKLVGRPYVIYLAQPTRILYPRKIDKETGLWLKRKPRFFPLFVKLTKPFIRWADAISIRGANKMLVNGSYMSNILTKLYQKEAVVCPAGAYPSTKIIKTRWQGKIKPNGFEIKKPYILLTNRHFPQKRFEYAIKALPKILKKVPQASLVITGNPTPYTEALKGLVRRLSLNKKVLFTGFVSGKDLAKLYRHAAVYVYTSPEEDFGMGVIEAMAAGVPVVAWNKGGPATTIVNDKTGFLVKPYSQSEFTEGILCLLKNREKNLRMGKKALERVKRYFTYRQHNDILEKILIEVVQ